MAPPRAACTMTRPVLCRPFTPTPSYPQPLNHFTKFKGSKVGDLGFWQLGERELSVAMVPLD